MVARVALVVAPTGMVTSLFDTVTVPLLAVTAVTIGPDPESTTFVDVNLSCFAASMESYAPSTYDFVTTLVLGVTSAKAGTANKIPTKI